MQAYPFLQPPHDVLHGDNASRDRARKALPYYLALKVFQCRSWDPSVSSPEFAELFHFDSKKAKSWFGHWRTSQKNQYKAAFQEAYAIFQANEKSVGNLIERCPPELQDLRVSPLRRTEICAIVQEAIDQENQVSTTKKRGRTSISEDGTQETPGRKQPPRQARKPRTEESDEEYTPTKKSKVSPIKLTVQAAPSGPHKEAEDKWDFRTACEALKREFDEVTGDATVLEERLTPMCTRFAERVATDDKVTGAVVIQRSGIASAIPLTFPTSEKGYTLGAVLLIPSGAFDTQSNSHGFIVQRSSIKTIKSNIKFGYAVAELKSGPADVERTTKGVVPELEHPPLVLFVGVGPRIYRSGTESVFSLSFPDADRLSENKIFGYGLAVDIQQITASNESSVTQDVVYKFKHQRAFHTDVILNCKAWDGSETQVSLTQDQKMFHISKRYRSGGYTDTSFQYKNWNGENWTAHLIWQDSEPGFYLVRHGDASGTFSRSINYKTWDQGDNWTASFVPV